MRKLFCAIDWPSTVGYGLLISLCALSTWSGTQPFLSLSSYSTFFEVLAFTSGLAMLLAYVCMTALSYFCFKLANRTNPLVASTLYIGGQFLTIFSGTQPELALFFLVLGNATSCIGAVLLYCLFQQIFASQTIGQCAVSIVAGTALSCVAYFLIWALPPLVRQLACPFVLAPLMYLLLAISRQRLNFSSPMFKDDPLANKKSYKAALRGLAVPVLCASAFVFASCVIRIAVFASSSSATIILPLSMLGAFIAACLLLALSGIRSFRFDVIASYRTLFPFVITPLALLPFMDETYLLAIGCLIHALSVLATMIGTIQCAQAARENGLNPIFPIALFNSGMCAFSTVGTELGTSIFGLDCTLFYKITAATIVCFWVFSLVLYFARGATVAGTIPASRGSNLRYIEFFVPPTADIAARSDSPLIAPMIREKEELFDAKAEITGSESHSGERKAANRPLLEQGASLPDTVPRHIQGDVIAHRCKQLSRTHRLTTREAEVFELLARGNSLPSISEALFISESTARFHRNHIYEKLDVHKRSELLALVNTPCE